jgi:peptidase YpeB-like protein
MHRVARLAAISVILVTASVAAQTTPPADQIEQIPASKLTELQVRERIDKQGYTAVTGLKQDSAGVWRGSATKDGKTVEIMLDEDGKVVEKP